MPTLLTVVAQFVILVYVFQASMVTKEVASMVTKEMERARAKLAIIIITSGLVTVVVMAAIPNGVEAPIEACKFITLVIANALVLDLCVVGSDAEDCTCGSCSGAGDWCSAHLVRDTHEMWWGSAATMVNVHVFVWYCIVLMILPFAVTGV